MSEKIEVLSYDYRTANGKKIKAGSLKESMDEFRFRELAEHMEKRDFASFVRAETV